MEQLSRVHLYRNMLDKSSPDSLSFTIRVNLEILDGVEEFFLTTDIGNETREYDYWELLDRIRRNIHQLEGDANNTSRSVEVGILKDNLNHLLGEYERKKGKSGRNLFNKIINELGIFNKNLIKRGDFDAEAYPRDNRPQVFLSHAYSDKAYTWSLFDYFYDRGIYLYVDWMHRDEEKDGRILKKYLKEQLNNSSQLLFLRTLNSELDIQGKQYLKPWCSWELGSFYNGHSPHEKYLLNLYSVDGYQNVQLHGLKLYMGIIGQRLQGIEITP